MAVLVEVVEEAAALLGDEALAVQKGRGGLERGAIAAAENLVQVEAQQAVAGPLSAFQKKDLAGGKEQYPARRVLLAEDAAGNDVAPGLAEQRIRRRRLAVVLGAVRLEGKRIFVLSHGVVGAEHQQIDLAVLARGVKHRHFVAVVESVVSGLVLVTEGGEKLAEPGPLMLNASLVPALACEAAPEPQIVAGQSAQRVVGRPGAGAGAARRLRFVTPAGDGLPDVPGEDLGEVVLAVELVLVVDAGERGCGVGGHRFSSPRLRRRSSRR